MERKTKIPKEAMCQALETGLRQEGVGYGRKDSLWLVSPRYFTVSQEQFGKMAKISYLLQQARVEYGESDGPFYFRGDFIPLQDGRMALAEYNETPVGEGEISALRRVYEKNLNYPDEAGWGFDDAAVSMSQLLANTYPDKRIAIIIPEARMGYKKDYLLLARYAKDFGVNMQVFGPDFQESDVQEIDVIYRAFQESDLEDWVGGTYVWDKYQQGELEVFPDVPRYSSKELMAKIFMEEDKQGLQEMLPWTWMVDQESNPQFQKESFGWKEVINGDFPVPLVLKMSYGREGKQVVFSDEDKWGTALKNALFEQTSTWVVQQDFSEDMQRYYKYPYLSPKGTIRWQNKLGARLCFTMVGESLDEPRIADMDVSMLKGRIMHTTSHCVHLPVLIEND